MRLDMTVESSDHVLLYINGQFVAEIAVQQTQARDGLAEEVAAARCLQAVAGWLRALPARLVALDAKPDHAHKTVEQRQAAWLRGLRDGMAGTTVAYPGALASGLPGLPAEHSGSYRAGYREGDAYRRALAQIPERKEETYA